MNDDTKHGTETQDSTGSSSAARPGGWDTPREFAFGANSSNFSFADLDKNEKQKDKEKDGEDKKEEFGFPDAFDTVSLLGDSRNNGPSSVSLGIPEINGQSHTESLISRRRG